MTAVGITINSLLQENDKEVDKLQILDAFWNVLKILADVHHKQTQTRKAFINPTVTPHVRKVLKKTKSDMSLRPKLKTRPTTGNKTEHLNSKGPSMRQLYAQKTAYKDKNYQGASNFPRSTSSAKHSSTRAANHHPISRRRQ